MNATTTTPEYAALAATYRAAARRSEKDAHDSFDRCDTDGFLSQWASDQMACRYLAAADLADNNGRSEFVALFDLEGNLVPARQVETRYGWAWLLLDEDGQSTGRFFNESNARKPETARANNAKKGIYVGAVEADADIQHLLDRGHLRPAAHPLLAADIVIIDNGQ